LPRAATALTVDAVRGVGITAALALALALAVAAPASAYDLIDRGKTGRSAAKVGSCKYGVYGPNGILTVGIDSPVVTGANTRRRTRRERTWVRYRVDVTNAGGSYETLMESGYSDFFRVRQNKRYSLPGSTFNMDWRSYYGADVLIEWWNSTRRIGYRWHRLEQFLYFDNYNRGPWGPFPNCSRWNFPYS
jgi:hypothetical protein